MKWGCDDVGVLISLMLAFPESVDFDSYANDVELDVVVYDGEL